MLDARSYRICLAFCALLIGGCSGGRWPLSSKWAMADADYARKYGRPYEDNERYPRMAKQMIDARHVAGKQGVYLGGAGQSDPTAGGLEVGIFSYAENAPWLEGRAGLSALASSSAEDLFAGINAGVRAQTPSRIAPFVGVGAYGGITPYGERQLADNDGIDNDDDFFIDEPGEERLERDWIFAVYPEVGLHIWATPSLRITGSASYMITTEGRDHDFIFYGVNLAWIALREREEWQNPYLHPAPGPSAAAAENTVDESPETLVRLPSP